MIQQGGHCKYCKAYFKFQRIFCYINDGKLRQTELPKLCTECTKKQEDLNLEWINFKWKVMYESRNI